MKALEQGSLVRHTEAMGCEFMFGRDPIAFTVNNLNAKVNTDNLAQEVECRFKTSGRMGAQTRMHFTQHNLQYHKQERTELERCSLGVETSST